MSELDTLDAPEDDDPDSECTRMRIKSLHAQKRYLTFMLVLAALMLVAVVLMTISAVMLQDNWALTMTDICQGGSLVAFLGIAIYEMRKTLKEKQTVLLLSRTIDMKDSHVEVQTRYINALVYDNTRMLQEKLGR